MRDAACSPLRDTEIGAAPGRGGGGGGGAAAAPVPPMAAAPAAGPPGTTLAPGGLQPAAAAASSLSDSDGAAALRPLRRSFGSFYAPGPSSSSEALIGHAVTLVAFGFVSVALVVAATSLGVLTKEGLKEGLQSVKEGLKEGLQSAATSHGTLVKEGLLAMLPWSRR